MGRADERYEREHAPTGLAIKRATSDVPNDGRFYLVRAGAILGSFRTERAALEPYRRAIQESGWAASLRQPVRADFSALAADQAAAAAEEFWHDSAKFRRRGGKGRW